MDLYGTFAAFLSSPEALAIKGLLLGAFLVFALGILAALRDGTFAWQFVDSFVRSTIWGRVAPVATVLLVGYLAQAPEVSAAGLAAAAAVSIGMIAAALASIRQMTLEKPASAEANTPPTA